MLFRILFVSLEFSAAPFSGNGFYSQSQVRALCGLGYDVFVISGKPAGHKKTPLNHGARRLEEVELSDWGRVDRHCKYQEFADGCSCLQEAVKAFNPHVALGVDWSARRAAQIATAGLHIPFVFLSYRVFLRSCLPEDAAFYRVEELAAAQSADLTIVLCPSDSKFLQQLCTSTPAAKVLLPCLRADLARLSLPADMTHPEGPSADRQYLTCCVRLSPEKDPERFVELVEDLHARGLLEKLQVIPLLCASTATSYAEALRKRVRAAAPQAIVEERFLGAAELAAVYQRTLLNFHPPRTEAFGMTIVEAASQGAPSVVNSGDGVGAVELLKPSAGEILQLDYSRPRSALAEQLAGLLSDRNRLHRVGRLAASKARSWSEEANAEALVGKLKELQC